MTRTELASVDPVKVLALLKDLSDYHEGYSLGVGPCMCEPHVKARLVIAAARLMTEPAESVVGMLAAEELLLAALDPEGECRAEDGEHHTLQFVRAILAASPALRARLAVAPDERLREALADMCSLVETTLHDGLDYFDHDGGLVGDWQQRLDDARALLSEPKPASPAVEGGDD